jgi:hypothetical protein
MKTSASLKLVMPGLVPAMTKIIQFGAMRVEELIIDD